MLHLWVAAFIQPIFDIVRCLWAPIGKRINYARNLSKDWEKFCKKASKLGTQRDDIDTQIEQSKPHKTPTKECEDWKTKARKMENQTEILKQKFDVKMKCLRGLCPDVLARIELGERMVDMINEIEELLEKSKFENGFLTDSLLPKVEKKLVSDSQLTASASNTLEKKDTRGSWTAFIISTTNESNERVASKFLQKLEGKKYLLLLDDVWEKVDLSIVGFPYAHQENGCKVVLTTRKLEVCRKMETDDEIKVEGLPKKEAWEMFNLKVGNFAMSPTIRQHAEEIVKKCGGLPLALKVVGGALRKVKNENVWRQFLRDLKSPAEALIEDINEEVYKSLKGLLSSKFSLADACVKGDVILEALIDASLLENCDGDAANNYVKMHDVVRDLVLAMTSPKGEERSHLVRSGTSTEKMPEDEEWKKATRISFIDNRHFSNLPESPDCPMLLTLLLQGCSNVKVIPEYFFNNMPRLCVLDLSNTGINSLPVSISKLVNLRELLLNGCSYLNVLPMELSELKALEVLEVIGTKLNHLPLWIFELTNLKRLQIFVIRFDDNFVDSGQILVPGLISKISQMEEFCVPNFLYDFGVSDESEDIVASELSSFCSLSSLQFHFLRVSNLQYFLQNSRSWREGKLTEFSFFIGHRDISDSWIWNKRLRYTGGRGEAHSILPWAIQDVLCLSNYFKLVGHEELTTLSDLGARNTYKLKCCCVHGCDMLENVVNGNGLEMDAFPNLEILELHNLRNLKCILQMEGPLPLPPPPPPPLAAN
ncbi:hypothetical protein Acr_29g0005640 [Actinidia rufa]|uniref:NB-ARC domain-containing disease resistance protein n=1 Tax=Actinidia rufa TaxID=165716 RepID=A0A7J0HEE5_9ERIC|nr:hypothetical protein Acr_29g0005640 [Actinidia rufa]